MNMKSKAASARKASLVLASIPTMLKNRALKNMADALERNASRILTANEKDVVEAKKLSKQGKLKSSLVERLKITKIKIREMARGIRDVARLDEPVGKTLSALKMDTDLELYQVTCPIGVIGAIFESRPDVVPQISSLCIKSGNAVIMKGGSEAKNSNKILADILSSAAELTSSKLKNTIQLVETREEIREMLKLDEYIDLIVPRGSNAFVKYIQDNTRIAVLGHSDGICHAYVDKDASLKKAISICIDAKTQYAAVCNTIETLLVHKHIADKFLPAFAKRMKEECVELRCDSASGALLKGFGVKKASQNDWSTEYNDLILSIKIVNTIEQAIEHINTYGSKHTDVIITENNVAANKFFSSVDSGCVFLNCSTRFSDGFRFGKGAEVGISTNKIHARGPVGLEGLIIYKYFLKGKGQIVKSYSGKNAKRFLHDRLNKKWEY